MSDAQRQANKTTLAELQTGKDLPSSQKIQAVAIPTHFYISKYSFFGNSMQLSAELDLRTNSSCKYESDIKIDVKGLKCSEPGCLPIAICFIGTLLIFPLVCLMCDCFQKLVVPLYKIQTEIYRKIARLNRSKALRYFELTIQDNYFNQQKADIIYNFLKESNCTGFIFVNNARNIDVEDGQYSRFDQYMQMFKTIPNLQVNIKWDNKLIS